VAAAKTGRRDEKGGVGGVVRLFKVQRRLGSLGMGACGAGEMGKNIEERNSYNQSPLVKGLWYWEWSQTRGGKKGGEGGFVVLEGGYGGSRAEVFG